MASNQQLTSEARQVFKNLKALCDKVYTESNSPDIQFDALRKLKYLSKEQDIPVLDFLLRRQSIYQINTQGEAKYSISQEEFIELFSGEYLREAIYRTNIEEQRYYVEDLTKLYMILGGQDDGISASKLKTNLSKYFSENQIEGSASKECQEIIDLLGSENDKITLEDFVNIMTCQTPIED